MKRIFQLTAAVLAFVFLLSYSSLLLFPVQQAPENVSVGFGLAFLGGILALLSPCSAVLLPAFFSYSFKESKRLLEMTYIFFLGLLVIFIPLGFATSVIAFLFSVYRHIVFLISGLVLIGLGILKIFSIPLPIHFSNDSSHDDTTVSVFLTGMLFGFTTISCTGPILGGIMTIAVGTGITSIYAIALLGVFAFGLVVPLFILSAIYDRFSITGSWLFASKNITVFGKKRDFLAVDVVTGSIFVLLGILFIFYERLDLYLGGKVTSDIYLDITSYLYGLDLPISLVLLAALIPLVWVIRKHKT